MKSELVFAACALALLGACSEGPPIAVAVIGLGTVPDRVATISVSVLDVERNVFVTSATAARDGTEFELGVPAEVLLEFRAVGRSVRPGPLVLGDRMPAYVARARRTLRLQRDRQLVSLVAVPAGVLTLLPDVGREDAVTIRFLGERDKGGGVDVALPDEPTGPIGIVLPAGAYRAEVPLEEGASVEDAPDIEGGEGIYVARELESILALRVRPPALPLEPEAARTLILALEDSMGRALSPSAGVRTSSSGETALRLRVTALDSAGRSVELPDARVEIFARTVPPELLRGTPARVRTGLPALFDGLSLRGTGRAQLRVSARLEEDDRQLGATLAFNALLPGRSPGAPDALELELDDPARLVDGAQLEIRVLDRNGLLSPISRAEIDLSASDPWAYFPEGRVLALDRTPRALASRRITRPSSPRGLPVLVRATWTATAVPHALTATLVLPLLRQE